MAKEISGKEKAAEKWVIVIEEEEGKPNYEVIGVDGNFVQIMRGVEITVPYSFVHILENSKASRQVKETDAQGKTYYVSRDYNTIPYRVLRKG
jgi:hypothetical protein